MQHKVQCIEVEHISEPKRQPNYRNIYKLFPALPPSCLERPNTKIGLLIGQNASILLPLSAVEQRFNNIRIRCTILGQYGYVVEGHQEDIWISE